MSRQSHLGQWGRPGHEAEAVKKRKQATQCASRISIMWGENLKTLTNYVSNAAYKVKGLITQPGVHETSSTATYKLTYTSLQAISNVTTDRPLPSLGKLLLCQSLGSKPEQTRGRQQLITDSILFHFLLEISGIQTLGIYHI